MRPYFELARKSFQKRMQYRIANLAGLGTNFFFAGVRILIFSAFYANQTEPVALKLQEVITYVCVTQALLMVTPVMGVPEMVGTIRTGAVSMELLKPVDFYLHWFASEIGKSAYYAVMRGIPILILSRFLFGMSLPPNIWDALLFLISLVFAVGLSIAMEIFFFGTTFWTLESAGVAAFTGTIVIFFSGFLVPISLWPQTFQQIAHWLPFEGLVFLPINIYLGKMSGAAVGWVLTKQALWFVLFLVLGRWIVRRGLRKLVIQGG